MYYYINCIQPVITFDVRFTKLGAEFDLADDIAKMEITKITKNYKKLQKITKNYLKN